MFFDYYLEKHGGKLVFLSREFKQIATAGLTRLPEVICQKNEVCACQ